MKKYFIQGMLALAATLMLTGCHEEDVFSGSTLDQKAKAYEETFVEAFGMPNKNHTWGFGTTGTTRTRTVLKEDMWDDNQDRIQNIKNKKPAEITVSERAIVKDWFEKHPGLTKGADIKNFFLQHVYGEANKDYNVWYLKHDQAGNFEDYRDDYVAQATLDYLELGDGTTYDHINDFNANDGAKWDIVYIENGSALDFRVKSSWCSETYNRFKLAHIDSAGVDGWYVGIAMYGEKYDNGQRKLNEDKKDFCDDWILKIVPGVGETIVIHEEEEKPKVYVVDQVYTQSIITETEHSGYETEQLVAQGRVFCEDLGSTGRTDIDFNDLVFDAKIWHKTKYDRTFKTMTYMTGAKEDSVVTDSTIINYEVHNDSVLVLAAGGTLPLSFAQKGELNGIFGIKSYLTMVNTVTEEAAERMVGGTKYSPADPKLLTMTGYKSINEIPIWVEFAKDTEKLNHYVMDETETGYIPRCILVPLGTQWATERTPIDSAYAYFTDYVQNMTDCWNQAQPSSLYPNIGGLEESPEDAYTLRKFGEFSETSTSTSEGGEDYVYHWIEVDQVVPEMVGTQLEVEGAGPLTQYDNEGNRFGGIYSNDYAYIPGSQFPENGRIKVRIYGIGADNDGYVWRLYTGTTSTILSGGDMTDNSYNSVAGRDFLAANGYIETDFEAADFHGTGWYLAGCNFTLLGVTIVTEDDLKEEQGQGSSSGEGIQINGEFDFANNNSVFPQYDFSSAGEGSVLRIYGMYYKPNKDQNTSNTWSLNVTTGWDKDLTFSNIDDPHNINNNVVEIGDQEGCIELIFTGETGRQISTQGNLKIAGTNFKMTKLTFEKK